MDGQVEHEICANCKKEIPHYNYVMHTAHCARNITLCKTCKEPVPKAQYEEHAKKCPTKTALAKKPTPPPLDLEKNEYYRKEKAIQDKKLAQRKERYLERHEKFIESGNTLGSSGGAKPKGAPPAQQLTPCKYCELELPEGRALDEHEAYCGARTDKCQECGELVMFKYRQLHEETNHGFLKLSDEPGPKPSWDSNTSRSVSAVAAPTNLSNNGEYRRRRPSPLLNFSTNFDLPAPVVTTTEKKESYKEISRRLDCKTEYIRNLLHDSASITVPLRSNGAVPRNHFNHNKGPAPQPPSRRRNPPTELEIPCEFCDVPIPHEDLIRHQTGCRPDLARFNPRRMARSPSPEYYVATPPPSSPEVELPCEFCSDMIPASQLLRHQSTCI